MTIETRPVLASLSDEQRVLAQAHWWVWRAIQECQILRETHLPDVSVDWWTLQILEAQMQPETLRRLAMARRRYFAEIRCSDC